MGPASNDIDRQGTMTQTSQFKPTGNSVCPSHQESDTITEVAYFLGFVLLILILIPYIVRHFCILEICPEKISSFAFYFFIFLVQFPFPFYKDETLVFTMSRHKSVLIVNFCLYS